MKHTPKRILSILAAASLSCCSLPQSTPLSLLRPALTVAAGETPNPASEFETSQIGDAIQITGWNGSGDTVVIPDEIDGLPVNEIRSSAFKDKSLLTEVIIPDSVTAIGKNAFNGCAMLSKLTLPESVRSIGEGAFCGCLELTEFTIPEGVTKIEYNTFAKCGSLGSVTIPQSVTSIGKRAFDSTALTAVTLPDGLTEIGEYAFAVCRGLCSITIPDGVTDIGDSAFSDCRNLNSITLPKNLKRIGIRAFEFCGSLKSVTVPDGAERIDSLAFSNSGLTDITVPASVTEIGGDAFQGCGNITIHGYTGSYAETYASIRDDRSFVAIDGASGEIVAEGTCGENLTWALDSEGTLTISGTGDMENYYHDNMPWTSLRGDLKAAVIEKGVTSIGESAFYECKALTSVSIPEGVTGIGEDAFNYCKALTSVTIPEGVTSIGEEAFYLCESLVSVTIPDSVTNIEREAFRASAWLKNEQAKNPLVIAGKMLVNGQACKGAVTIPDGVKYIADYAFEVSSGSDACDDMTSVVIPDSVTEIGKGAFKNCEKLTEVRLSNGLTCILTETFWECEKLNNVVIPDSVTTLNHYAFTHCTSLSSVTIPESVTEFGQGVFQDTVWLADRQAENPVVTVNGIVIDGKTCKGEVMVSDGAKGIAYGAFSSNENITAVTLPDGTTEIGDYAFGWCSGLTEITIPQSVNSIGEDSFTSCRNLTIKGYAGSYAESYANENNIPFVSLGEAPGVLSGTCGENVTWELQNGVLTISGTGKMANYTPEDSPFSGLSFSKAVISDGVTSIGNHAFASCSVLRELCIPESVTLIGSEAFVDCTALTEVIVPDGVTEIWTAAFGGCSSLTSVKLPDSLTEISPFIFESCPITEITLPSEAMYIGDGAFEDCKLTSISIPSKVSTISAWAFCGCPLTEVTVPENVEEIKHDAFNCTALSDITILNPACILFDDVNTINSSATIHGFAGSTAEEYANKYDRRFEAITSPASVSGDFNGDGEITVADAVLLIRFITEDGSLTQDEIDRILSGNPDINGDGLVTITDVTELLHQLEPEMKPEVIIKETKAPDAVINDNRFESDGKWYDISSPAYDGLSLSGDVFLTASIPGEIDPENLGSYVFVYYDEKNDECRYLFPDSYDLTAGTMTIDLPHFSFWGTEKLTKEAEIEAFLNSYSTKLAVERGNVNKAASELEPYVRAKAEAMGLTQQATEDLIQSSLNFLGGRFTGKNKAFIETGTKYTTTLTRGYYDKNDEAAMSGLEDAITDALMNSWDELGFSDRLDKVLGSEFAGSTTAKLLSSSNGIARMAGYLTEGDTKEAMKELGSVMQGIHPAVELGTKAIAYLGAKVNEEFTNWKSNQIEELYQIYKNGLEDIWGNEVIPCNRDSFLIYLNTSSGFTKAKGVARFYNLDKVGEICEQFGWEYRTYEELPPRYLEKFQQRAENGLMEYFELRLKQEKIAEEIKKTERACIETMMADGYGALVSSQFREFFDEATPDDYNLIARLERLVNVRSFVSQYVDEDKLAEAAKVDNSYNYGDILNWWVDLASNNEKSVAIQKFREELRTHGFLKEFTDQKVTSLVLEKTVDDSGCSPPNSNYSEYTIFYRVKDVKTDAEGNEVIVWKDDSLKRNYPYFSPGSYKSEVWTLLKNAEISVSADGKISCSEEGVKVEGFFDPISKTGLGSLSIHTKSTYDYRERTESYCRSCITLDNHFPNDTPDYYVDRTIDLTLDLEIMPNSDETGVLFVLNGGGTVASSGEVIDTISGIIKDDSVTPPKLLEDESGLVITGRAFSDSFAVTFEDVQYLYLVK